MTCPSLVVCSVGQSAVWCVGCVAVTCPSLVVCSVGQSAVWCVGCVAVTCPSLALREVSPSLTGVGAVVNVSCPPGHSLYGGHAETTVYRCRSPHRRRSCYRAVVADSPSQSRKIKRLIGSVLQGQKFGLDLFDPAPKFRSRNEHFDLSLQSRPQGFGLTVRSRSWCSSRTFDVSSLMLMQWSGACRVRQVRGHRPDTPR